MLLLHQPLKGAVMRKTPIIHIKSSYRYTESKNHRALSRTAGKPRSVPPNNIRYTKAARSCREKRTIQQYIRTFTFGIHVLNLHVQSSIYSLLSLGRHEIAEQGANGGREFGLIEEVASLANGLRSGGIGVDHTRNASKANLVLHRDGQLAGRRFDKNARGA